MRHISRLPILTLALLLSGANLDAQSTARRAAAPPDFAAIDRHVERLLREGRVPGAAIAIVHQDSIVHLRGFGRDSRGEPITGRTSFTLGSMSKSITAIAVMQLVEQGRVELDRPVRQYLPSFRLASSDSGAAITVRQLLLHTSGIPHKVARVTSERPALGDHVAALRTVEPEGAPGSSHRYASPNYQTLGAIVEQVTGESFAAYVERAVFAPLAMRNSPTRRQQALDAGFAGGHVSVLGFPVRSSMPEEADRLPTAGLMSSAEDLSHTLIMLLGQGQYRGARVLGDSTVRTMLTGGAPSDGFSYAFGWRDGTIAGTRAVHHGGIVSDFAGRMIMLPELGYGVVVLTNLSSAVPWPVGPTSHGLAHDIAANLAGEPLPQSSSRRGLLFFGVGLAMLALVASQLRSLWRAWRGIGSPSRSWRASALDVGFLVLLALVPRFVGLTWTGLLRGAPDVGWWLLLVAVLTAATVVGRVVRGPGRRIPA